MFMQPRGTGLITTGAYQENAFPKGASAGTFGTLRVVLELTA